MAKIKLTQRVVELLKTDKKSEIFWDKEFSAGAFGIRVQKSGTKTYLIDYRNASNTQRRIVVGNASLINLPTARKEATKLLLQISEGYDPKTKNGHQNSLTVSDLCEMYIEKHATPNKAPTSVRGDKRTIAKELLPTLGKRKINDVSRRDLIALIDEIRVGRGKPVMAKRTHALVHRIFRFAIERELLEINPASHFPKFKAEKPKDRFLDLEEVKRLIRHLNNCKKITSDVFSMILLTAQRPGEVSGMRYDEIKDDLWTIPAERAKNRMAQTIPLPDLAKEILERRKQKQLRVSALEEKDGRKRPNHFEYVFPTRIISTEAEKGHTTWNRKACNEIVTSLGIPHFTPHDLRRTAATHLRKLGCSRDTLKKILNHKDSSSDVTAVYDHYSELDEKKLALERWNEKLCKLLSENSNNEESPSDDL